MKFNSQICTSIEQSRRLLELGLKKETADMVWRYSHTMKGIPQYELMVEASWSQEVIDEYVRFGTKIGLFDGLMHPDGTPVTPLEARADVVKNDIPAWSLHRLLSILPDYIVVNSSSGLNPNFYLNIRDGFVSYKDNRGFSYGSTSGNMYDAITSMISFLIKVGYFPKEYLEE